MARLLCGFALIALIDLIPIIRKKSWRALIVFLVLYLSALAISVLLVLNIDVPSTMIILDKALKAVHLSY